MKTKEFISLCLCMALMMMQPVAYALSDGLLESRQHESEENHDHDDEHGDEKEDDHDEHGDEKEGDHDEHGDEKEGDHDDEGVVKLSEEQMKAAGIIVEKLQMRSISTVISAPGEVRLNAYRTAKIASRIPAQIVDRHARLGDEVVKGQPLITLSSVEMAEAQGKLLVIDREWRRVKKLGRDVVSERRYIEAQVDWEQSRSKVQAYGMTLVQINELIKNPKASSSNGTFQLLSSQAGRVLHDEFIVGERVEAGRELMEIADESVLWVEARISPNILASISSGNEAVIEFSDSQLAANVSQIHHSLDETTRTIAIRLEVDNKDDVLHPGMFVTAKIETNGSSRALILPEAAVLRGPDGDWQVYVEQDEEGEFKAVEVELENVSGGKAAIEGLQVGAPVVVQGAFFVQSEMAKSGFDIHNH